MIIRDTTKGIHIVVNLAVVLTFIVAAILHTSYPGIYNVVVQEDRAMEWATFWGFFVAFLVFGRTAIGQLITRSRLPWFEAGLSIFCFLVAMEEISWGQRIFGYEAPSYFLEKNFQQELNLHNVVGTDTRMFLMQAILLIYGVLLSATSTLPPFRDLLDRMQIRSPPPQLIGSFLLISIIYAWYPWSHTGEWVELSMAYCFAFAAVSGSDLSKSATQGVLLLAAIWVLAAITFALLRVTAADEPHLLAMAEEEVGALGRDFSGPNLHTRCNIHKRLFTFSREYGQTYVFEGEFAQMVSGAGDSKRAEFALDPWNSAYWIRHKCSNDREVSFVYSFGPNRRRDSNDWELGGDDIGVYLPAK